MWATTILASALRRLVPCLTLCLALLHSAGAAPPVAPVLVMPVRDAIGPASADHIVRGIAAAERGGRRLVVLQLDTPGGLDSAMRDIIRAILASPVPVVTWVAPSGARAASAGTYILYASHVAAMAPATTLGAATPVAIGLGGVQPPREPASAASDAGPADPMTAKRVHDAAAFIRGLAQRHGRNAEWAERAVREAVSLTADEALQQHVVDVVAADLPQLLERLDGRTVRLGEASVTLATRGAAAETLLPDWRHQLLSVIANPSLALVLMMVGIYGLLFEFSSPGFGVPGTVGAICLLLAMFALQMLPVNYAAVGLILLGIALLAAELVSPSFGVLGAGGLVAFVAGAILLVDRDVPGLGVPLPLVFGLAATSALVVLVGGRMALRARSRPVVSGGEALLGALGTVLESGPDGAWAQVAGERWAVRCDAPLQPGQRVRVHSREGLLLAVLPEPAVPTNSPGGPP
ncbi:MAG: nodulation protein NfeD [Piscinibacter sp.]|nr:nodulation protein NfeD [Piscinibacter sp.]